MNITPGEVLSALRDSGYLFEQEIATRIEDQQYHIMTNAAFKDLEESKSREMDIVAYKRYYHNEEKKISVGIRILCECKNSTSPFAFITRNKGRMDEYFTPPNFLFPKEKIEVPINERSFREIRAYWHFDIASIFPYAISPSKAVQFCKLIQKNKAWSAFHDGIYDSLLLPLTKCLEFHKRKDFIKDSDWQRYMLYFPVVVINSKMFCIESHIDPSIVQEVEHMPFVRAINTDKQNETYLIDFVTSAGLEKYLQDYVDAFAEKFVDRVSTVSKK